MDAGDMTRLSGAIRGVVTVVAALLTVTAASATARARTESLTKAS